MRPAPRGRLSQSGQALLEWLLVAMLATMAAVWAAAQWVSHVERAAEQGHAQWLLAVANGLSQAIEAEPQRWHGQLAAHQPVALEPVLQQLQEAGWLPRALRQPAGVPYALSVLRWQPEAACQAAQCPAVVLLLAVPKREAPSAVGVLTALEGRGLAVTDLNPAQLQGAAYTLPNPLVRGLQLPVGTLALLIWRSTHEPPYVRLHETRPVTLAGGVTLGPLADAQASCKPNGHLTQSTQGQLLVCQAGRWQALGADQDHLRACQRPKMDPYAESLSHDSGLWAMFGLGSFCPCDKGFGAVRFGQGLRRVGPVLLYEGFACLRL